MMHLWLICLVYITTISVVNGALIDTESNANTTIRYLSQNENIALDLTTLANFELMNGTYDVIYSTQDRTTMKLDVEKHLEISNGFDVIGWYSGGEVSRDFISKGYLHDLHSMYERTGLYDEIPASLLKGISDENGHPYMVPTDYYHWGIYYNKNLLTGAQVNISKVPETYDEFLDACWVLKEANIQPIAIGYSEPWTIAGWFDYLNMRINGPTFHIDLTAGEVDYTDPRVRNVFQKWKEDFLDTGFFPSFEDGIAGTWVTQGVSILTKQAGFTLMGDFIRTYMTPEQKAEIDFIQFPILNPDVPVGEDAPTDGVMISAKSTNKRGAEDLAQFFASPAYQRQRLGHTAIPANLKVVPNLTDPIVLRGAEMIANSDYVVQFYDRDTKPEMAAKGLESFTKFLEDPTQIDKLLRDLEAYRQQIYLGFASTPVVSVPSGTYSQEIHITLTTLTEDATIYFTLDGTIPTLSSEKYERPVTIAFHGRHTLRAMAFRKGLQPSEVAQETYNIVLFSDTLHGVTSQGRAITISAALVSIVFNWALLLVVVKFRKQPVFMVTSPNFVMIMIIGSILAISTVFPSSKDVTNGFDLDQVSSSCMEMVWLTSVAWSLVFGALVCKTWRIAQLFGNKGIRRKLLSNKQLLLYVCAYLAVEVGFTLVWEVTDPMTLQKVYFTDFDYHYTCSNSNATWAWISLSMKFVVLLMLIVLSILTRNVHSVFNESKSIAFVIYNIAVIGGVSFAVSAFIHDRNISNSIRSFGVIVTANVTSAAIVWPKIYILFWNPGQNSFTPSVVSTHSIHPNKTNPKISPALTTNVHFGGYDTDTNVLVPVTTDMALTNDEDCE